MVFWKSYPIVNILKSKLNNDRFKGLIFERDIVKSPTGIEGEIIRSQDVDEIYHIKHFLKQYFGNPPHTPTLDIPLDKLLNKKDYILFVRDKNNNIAGCIRYRYMGIFVTDKNQPIYSEDCFCIHPKWRKKGVGDYLLTTLHIFVNKHNIPYSMFLKEGNRLSIINQPFYSSMYVYRQLECSVSHNIQSLSTIQAYNLMDMFRELQPKMFIIRNLKADNQLWKLYRLGTCKILACIQDTYQTFEEEGKVKKIGWITGWIESSDVTDECRENASKELSDSMYGIFDYIWANSEWIGSNLKSWKIDGQFNWYLYQWTTSASIKKSYVIIN
jgi:hypothetical protein